MSSAALEIHVQDLRELSEENQDVAEVILDMLIAAEDEINDDITIE